MSDQTPPERFTFPGVPYPDYLQPAALKADITHHLMYVVLFVTTVLALAGGGVAVHFADKALSKADAAETRYDSDRKAWQSQLDSDKAERLQLSQHQVVVQKEIEYRDVQAQQQVASAVAPKAIPAVVADSVKFLGVTPDITTDNKLAYESPAVQGFVATKIEHDQFKLDLNDLHTVLSDEQKKSASLQQDLFSQNRLTGEAERVAADYKIAAKLGRWKKFRNGALTGAAVGGAFYLGTQIKK